MLIPGEDGREEGGRLLRGGGAARGARAARGGRSLRQRPPQERTLAGGNGGVVCVGLEGSVCAESICLVCVCIV